MSGEIVLVISLSLDLKVSKMGGYTAILLSVPPPLGCTLQELWAHISTSSPSYTLDSYTKPFIWRQLLCIMKEDTSISLYRLPSARPAAASSGDTHPSSFCMISRGGVRGSCVCFDEREDVTSVVLGELLQLQQVEERCGRGCGVCTQELP